MHTLDIRTSAPCAIVSEHAFPSSAKSAERMDGAMMAGGAMAGKRIGEKLQEEKSMQAFVPSNLARYICQESMLLNSEGLIRQWGKLLSHVCRD
jgi:hypothetical protein